LSVLLDSNVLLRAADPSSSHHAVALSAVADLSSRFTICICAQCLYEFWSVATRPRSVNGLGLTPTEARAAVDDFLATYPLLPDPGDLVPRWLSLVTSYGVSGVEAHDARLAAVMAAHGVAYVLTFNTTDFARYTGVTAVDPHDPSSFPTP
jgi:predicted nucleic acid-binding protein